MMSAQATPDTFDRWAAVYDDSANPFCALEARLLDHLLPALKDKIVLDVGCGTGRHFDLLVRKGASQLHGIDFSGKMLEIARGLLPETGRLYCADCTAVPLPDHSIDVIVCSFVLGYVRDLHKFCCEMMRLLRQGGKLFLADVHPETANKFAWRRSFQANCEEVSIEWNRKHLSEIRSAFEEQGFHLQAELAVHFSEAERTIFAESERIDSFEKMRNEPVLYLLQFVHEPSTADYNLTGARVAISEHDGVQTAIGIQGEKVSFLLRPTGAVDKTLSLDGYMLLPGLINAHDHLEFGLFPRLGAGPYQDAKQWAEDIHSRYAGMIALHRGIPHGVRVRWGAVRNLLCGVTTVCHHNPVMPEMLSPDFPVRVVDGMRWIHSPVFDPDGLKAQADSPPDGLFVLHAGEGTSKRAANELRELHSAGLMRGGTILVHGLAIDPGDIETLRESGVGLVLCPSSNDFLFGRIPLPDLMTGFERAAIGNDSPLTARGDLLDEATYAASRYNMSSERLYAMLTASPATLLRLPAGSGQIQAGGVADVIAVKDHGSSPAQTLRELTWKDVHLVIRAGMIRMVSDELLHVLPEEERILFTSFVVDGESRWIRGSFREDFEATVNIQDNGKLLLGGRAISLA